MSEFSGQNQSGKNDKEAYKAQNHTKSSATAAHVYKPLQPAQSKQINTHMVHAEEERTFERVNIPESLKSNLTLFLHLVRKVIQEYDENLCTTFDMLLSDFIEADNQEAHHPSQTCSALQDAVRIINGLEIHEATMLARAFASYFHLANICEENYRVAALRAREKSTPVSKKDNPFANPNNDLSAAYHEIMRECGKDKANELLHRLEFHPVFTAHPTEARRKTVEARIRNIATLLEKRARLGGASLAENDRRMLEEIEALFRTSPIALKKPTPVEEADTIIDIFDHTLFEMVPDVYRRFDDWELGDDAGKVPPLCPAFFKPGSWIGTDRDGNPNVTAKVSRKVAEKFRTHMLTKLAEETKKVARSLTLDTVSTPASKQLRNLWNHQVEMSEVLSAHAYQVSASELHHAVLKVMANRLEATITRTADLMYTTAEDFISDLRIVQESLAQAGAVRAAYGVVQRLIWQAETFGFSLVQMEFRQHSLVHTRALEDIRAHGRWGERGELAPMTKEVLDTFRAIGSIQRRNGVEAARRYIISFTQSPQNIEDVYTLAHLAFAHDKDVPTLDVIPLFEQVEDLNNAIDTLNHMIEIPAVQKRLAQTSRRLEVMLGYSDSSKDAGPTSATLVLHETQARIAQWAKDHNINLILMHGRGGAVGRGGGPANRAVLSQPMGSVNAFFKLTEQGEVIFARYGDPVLARRHVESVAGATLLQSAPSIEKLNTETTQSFLGLAEELDHAAHARFLRLIHTEGFPEWFSTVTPLAEIGMMPIGSRPAKRGLGATSLADLRTIPWIFSWSQARTNLAAWYGLGTACEEIGDLARLRSAYKQWPLFTTFIDNIEMSLAKTDTRIAKMYLALGKRDDLTALVLDEMELTKKWVLSITGNQWPLEHRRVLGPLIRMRSPFVDVLSVTQAHALSVLRTRGQDLSPEEKEKFIYLILCTVSGVAAGLQNTG